MQWSGSINESVRICAVMVSTHIHTHVGTHCAPSSGSYHYPSLHPPFGISRPDRSWPITVSLRAVLSFSISPFLISCSLYPFFHTISPHCLSQPPHTALLCLQTVSDSKKLLKSPPTLSSMFLALLSPMHFFSIFCPPAVIGIRQSYTDILLSFVACFPYTYMHLYLLPLWQAHQSPCTFISQWPAFSFIVMHTSFFLSSFLQSLSPILLSLRQPSYTSCVFACNSQSLPPPSPSEFVPPFSSSLQESGAYIKTVNAYGRA